MYDFSLHELKIIKAEFEKFSGEDPNHEELLKTEKFFRRILKNNNAIKLLIDRETFQIVDSNELAQNFYGFNEEELQQKQIFEINALTKDEVIEEYERATEEDRDYFESRQKDANGNIKKVIVRSTPITLSGKNYFYLVIHELENEAEEPPQEEKPEVKDPTIYSLPNSAEKVEFDNDLDIIEKNARDLVILSNKLAESEEKLKEINASKDRFFSIISHDLKNSFFSIMSLSKKLTDPEFDGSNEQKTHIAQMLHENSKRLYSFLENLLTWARVQRGETIYEPGNKNLREITSEITDIFNLKADEKNISLENNIDESIEVFADENMVKTILRNLVSNAINFTKSGGNVKILSKLKDDEVVVSVKDDGVGISEENQKKLFRIDKKLIGRNTEGEKGTGLGLILCKEFIEKHGKEIWIESELGKGSRFNFTLPITKPSKD
ncbi:two-component sensor histidine kinase [hydrothermal vent metagenome]|uniref:histidine kinase n=1 Tax=hydrothermal vent metagenome TaxID=652676 RepID=A0A3B1CG63_9ZZZZ